MQKSFGSPASSVSIVYLDLVPPAPIGALHLERSVAALWALSQSMPISCKSSWKVFRHVIFGLPLFLLPPFGVHLMATFAGRSFGKRMTWPANLHLLVVTISLRSSIPALFISSSFVMWSFQDIPSIVLRHLRWNTSRFIGDHSSPFPRLHSIYCRWQYNWLVQA